MLTNGHFWIGIAVGAVGYHLWMKKQSKKG